MASKLTLYSYFRSSTSYRVRIALNLKKLAYRTVPVHLLRGEQASPEYRAVNPQMRLPSLIVEQAGKRDTLIQSPAILEWLEDAFPEPKLLPADLVQRAHCRAIAAIIGCDIHPLNNLGTLNELKSSYGADADQIGAWYRRWVRDGFEAIEALLEPRPFCFCDSPTLADIYLVPQVFNAQRYDVDLSPFPKIRAIDEACRRLEAFSQAAPDRQTDAPVSS